MSVVRVKVGVGQWWMVLVVMCPPASGIPDKSRLNKPRGQAFPAQPLRAKRVGVSKVCHRPRRRSR